MLTLKGKNVLQRRQPLSVLNRSLYKRKSENNFMLSLPPESVIIPPQVKHGILILFKLCEQDDHAQSAETGDFVKRFFSITFCQSDYILSQIVRYKST